MTPKQLHHAKDPDLLASVQAMQRAAKLARQTAIQTQTSLVIVDNQKMLHLSAQQLSEQAKSTNAE